MLPKEGLEALATQKRQQLQWRLKAGKDWKNTEGYVFTNEKGEPLARSTLQWGLREICESLEIPKVSPHTLRHLNASLMLASNVPVPVVASRLGHANSNITLSIYAHAFPDQDSYAADVLEKVLAI
ncbi:MAG: tyrosine-type recombinase/integrase [Ardenticatenaceae bacterium]|nr:tyrosine-type recombinase/integrase [Ardenticatenaceae bacterium]